MTSDPAIGQPSCWYNRGRRVRASKMRNFGPIPYKLLLRPLLFRLPPEAARKVVDLGLGRHSLWRALAPALRVRDSRLATELCGIQLKNPVGLAAGFDKDCQLLPSMAAMGFGYLVAGTVTELPRPGNPRPRLLRRVAEESLVNALGFPNKGLEHAARRLELAHGALGDTPLAVSVSGTTAEEIVRCHRRLEPLVDAVELNISSPNTEGLRAFHEPEALAELIGSINEARTRPLMVKLPPYLSPGPAGGSSEDSRERVMSMVRVCVESGVDALTVANSRPTVDPRLSTGAGGLSGRAVFADMLRMVADVRAEVGDRLAINACGGIFTGADAWKALKAGSSTVQLYTGLVYRGPGIVRQINRELVSIMERERAESVRRALSKA